MSQVSHKLHYSAYFFIFRKEKEKKEKEKILGVGFFQLVTAFFEHISSLKYTNIHCLLWLLWLQGIWFDAMHLQIQLHSRLIVDQ